jgi:hypothetical protein
MARKTKTFVIEAEGRDKGKHYLITELPASQAERWATRALMAMAKSGVDIPDNLETTGIAGLATLGLRALAAMPFDEAEILLAQMMTCVAFIPDPSRPMVFRSPPWEDDIEEPATRVRLRTEVIEIHTGFSLADALARMRAMLSPTPIQDTSDTPISQQQLVP